MANEKRLIDVDRVIFGMKKVIDERPGDKDTVAYKTFEAVISVLEKEPTVDAVEVVRCKDCKHYKQQNKSAHWNHKVPYCMRCGVSIKTNPDDFCSYGERRTDQRTLKDGDTNELEVRSN